MTTDSNKVAAGSGKDTSYRAEPQQPSLKSCPFCGGVAECRPDEVGSGGQHVPPYWVGCDTCRAQVVPDDNEESAIAAWNRRASPAPDPAQEAAPVAWRVMHPDGEGFTLFNKDDGAPDMLPLYASPPAAPVANGTEGQRE